MQQSSIFSYTFIVPQSAIDEYGHVNNVMYVNWMQEAGKRHPASIPEFKQPENTGWFAREHRIEYLTPAYLGDEIEVRTWMTEWKRARVKRNYEFIRKPEGRLIARGETQWVFVDLTTSRPISIPPKIAALFLAGEDQTDSVS